jgi:hypothetical protein
MVEARAAPTAELLEDVVRTPRPTSLEALSWRHPFALYHFLEALRRTFSPARRCRAPGNALPFARKEGKEDLSALRGGKLTREGISPRLEKEAYKRRLGTCPEGQDL